VLATRMPNECSSGSVTARIMRMDRRRSALTATTTIIHTPARPTATTVQTGLSEASSSVPVRGSMATMDADFTGVDSMEEVSTVGAITDAGITGGEAITAEADTTDTAAATLLITAGTLATVTRAAVFVVEDTAAMGTAALAAVSMAAEAASTEEAASTAAVVTAN
jgi:hypothetical protein